MRTALIISDRIAAVHSLRRSLERQGYQVDHCLDEFSAAAILAHLHYDMLVDHRGALRPSRVQ